MILCRELQKLRRGDNPSSKINDWFKALELLKIGYDKDIAISQRWKELHILPALDLFRKDRKQKTFDLYLSASTDFFPKRMTKSNLKLL
jgi:hypothetical protein